MADISKLIKDMQGDFGGDNSSQMKSLQILKGLATSDDPKANEFMKKLDKATTAISKEMSSGKKEESIEIKKSFLESELSYGDWLKSLDEGVLETMMIVNKLQKMGYESNLIDSLMGIYASTRTREEAIEVINRYYGKIMKTSKSIEEVVEAYDMIVKANR